MQARQLAAEQAVSDLELTLKSTTADAELQLQGLCTSQLALVRAVGALRAELAAYQQGSVVKSMEVRPKSESVRNQASQPYFRRPPVVRSIDVCWESVSGSLY